MTIEDLFPTEWVLEYPQMKIEDTQLSLTFRHTKSSIFIQICPMRFFFFFFFAILHDLRKLSSPTRD